MKELFQTNSRVSGGRDLPLLSPFDFAAVCLRVCRLSPRRGEQRTVHAK